MTQRMWFEIGGMNSTAVHCAEHSGPDDTHTPTEWVLTHGRDEGPTDLGVCAPNNFGAYRRESASEIARMSALCAKMIADIPTIRTTRSRIPRPVVMHRFFPRHSSAQCCVVVRE